MLRFLITILFLLISFSFVSEVVMVHKNAVAKTVLAEEEQQQENENSSQGKKAEESLKEKFFAHPLTALPSQPAANTLLSLYNQLHFSHGYSSKPYMPPELM